MMKTTQFLLLLTLSSLPFVCGWDWPTAPWSSSTATATASAVVMNDQPSYYPVAPRKTVVVEPEVVYEPSYHQVHYDQYPDVVVENVPDTVNGRYKDLSQPDEVRNMVEDELHIAPVPPREQLVDIGYGLHSPHHHYGDDTIVDVGFGLHSPYHYDDDTVVDVGFGQEPLVRPYIPPIVETEEVIAVQPGYPAYHSPTFIADEVVNGPVLPLGHHCGGHGACRVLNQNLCLCHCEPGYISELDSCILEHCAVEDYHCQETLAMRRAVNAELVGASVGCHHGVHGVDGICHDTTGELDILVGHHFVPNRHPTLRISHAHNLAACESDCLADPLCTHATYEHDHHQCLMYDVATSHLVVADFQPSAEAVLLVKRHYDVRHGYILINAPRIATIQVRRILPTDTAIMLNQSPGSVILVDYHASKEDVIKACEDECNGSPTCHGFTVNFGSNLCKLFAGAPHFECASAFYGNVASGLKKETAKDEIISHGQVVAQGREHRIPPVF